MKLDESLQRNLAINFYKDQGLILKENNEVHFQGGIAGYHQGLKEVEGRIKVVFSPSQVLKHKKFDYALGEQNEH
ncbi:hypothetical protein MASR1M48_16720 [Lactococcus petauri]